MRKTTQGLLRKRKQDSTHKKPSEDHINIFLVEKSNGFVVLSICQESEKKKKKKRRINFTIRVRACSHNKSVSDGTDAISKKKIKWINLYSKTQTITIHK